MTKIGVIGLGFVGLTTATGLAHLGYKVYCFEKDKKKIQTPSEHLEHLLSGATSDFAHPECIDKEI